MRRRTIAVVLGCLALPPAAHADRGAAFSPDGRRIAFLRGTTLIVARADGAAPRVVWTGTRTYSWSPTGARLLVRRTGEIWTVTADGRQPHLVAASDGPSDWSPDGSALAFVAENVVYVARPDGSGIRRLYDGGGDCSWIDDLRWSPNGTRLAFGGAGVISLYPFSICTGTVVLALGDGASVSCGESGMPLGWSPDGRRLAMLETLPADGDPTEFDATLAVYDVPSCSVWYPGPAFARLRWSPDGRHVVLTHFDRDFTNPILDAIYVARPDGTHRRRILEARDPVWSPNGCLLAFVHGNAISTTGAEAPGVRRLARGGSPRWSPDSRWILFARDGRIWRTRADGTRQSRVS